MTSSSIPAPRHVALTSHDLEAQIFAAEQAVVARDERLRTAAQAAGAKLRSTVASSLAVAAVGVVGGVGLWLGSRLLGGGRARHRRAAGAPLAQGRRPAALAPRRAPLPWGRFITLAWPLLPPSLRQRIDSRLVTLVGLALPVLATAAEPSGDDLLTAAQVDLARFSGRWFEIGAVPHGDPLSDVSTLYTLDDDAIRLTQRSRRADGSEALLDGEARVADARTGAKLKVSYAPAWLRWLPFLWGDQWILYVDAAYTQAVVGSPDRKQLWLLARQPLVDAAGYEALLSQARQSGFDPEHVVRTPQRT